LNHLARKQHQPSGNRKAYRVGKKIKIILMKFFKKILIALAIIGSPFLSKANMECSCTIGSESLGMTLTWFTVGADAGCANPTAGAALTEYMWQGQTNGLSYMSAQEAADLCTLSRIYGVFDYFLL
jgi:hypothetical protein